MTLGRLRRTTPIPIKLSRKDFFKIKKQLLASSSPFAPFPSPPIPSKLSYGKVMQRRRSLPPVCTLKRASFLPLPNICTHCTSPCNKESLQRSRRCNLPICCCYCSSHFEGKGGFLSKKIELDRSLGKRFQLALSREMGNGLGTLPFYPGPDCLSGLD